MNELTSKLAFELGALHLSQATIKVAGGRSTCFFKSLQSRPKSLHILSNAYIVLLRLAKCVNTTTKKKTFEHQKLFIDQDTALS